MGKLNFLPPFLSIITFVLTLLILLAGLNKHVLPDFYFFKTDTRNVSASSELSTSVFLQDLSTISGTDLVGPAASRTSLNISEEYTISLFGYCEKENGERKCSPRKIGFNFNPLKDLKLAGTSLSAAISKMDPYTKAAWFLGIGYIVAELLIGLTLILSFFNRRKTIVTSAVFSSLATTLLIAASAAAIAVFSKYKGTLNDKLLSSANIKSALGNRMFILSWVATAVSLILTIVLIIHAQRSKKLTRHRGVGLLDPNSTEKGGLDPDAHMVPRSAKPAAPGFLAKMPTWNRHKYAQIDEQQGSKGAANKKPANDADELISRGFGSGEDEDDEDRDLVRGATNQPRGIQLMPMVGGGLPSRDVDTAYEPYRAQAL
ncbi:SUR7/PalI family-domain-containing protein [Bisporella sp. PMI_857]|nr:SUR7/PalI family-domain-containing protein [Bisporella sp. PMI_857]